MFLTVYHGATKAFILNPHHLHINWCVLNNITFSVALLFDIFNCHQVVFIEFEEHILNPILRTPLSFTLN